MNNERLEQLEALADDALKVGKTKNLGEAIRASEGSLYLYENYRDIIPELIAEVRRLRGVVNQFETWCDEAMGHAENNKKLAMTGKYVIEPLHEEGSWGCAYQLKQRARDALKEKPMSEIPTITEEIICPICECGRLLRGQCNKCGAQQLEEGHSCPDCVEGTIYCEENGDTMLCNKCDFVLPAIQ